MYVVQGQVVGTFEIDVVAEVSAWVVAYLYLELFEQSFV